MSEDRVLNLERKIKRLDKVEGVAQLSTTILSFPSNIKYRDRMEEKIVRAIRKFENKTELIVTSIGVDKRFKKGAPLKIYSTVELLRKR